MPQQLNRLNTKQNTHNKVIIFKEGIRHWVLYGICLVHQAADWHAFGSKWVFQSRHIVEWQLKGGDVGYVAYVYIQLHLPYIKYSYIREHLLRLCVCTSGAHCCSQTNTYSLSPQQSHSRRSVTKSRKFACCDFLCLLQSIFILMLKICLRFRKISTKRDFFSGQPYTCFGQKFAHSLPNSSCQLQFGQIASMLFQTWQAKTSTNLNKLTRDFLNF